MLATLWMINAVEVARVHMVHSKFKRLFHLRALHRSGAGGVGQPCETPDEMPTCLVLAGSAKASETDEKAATNRIRDWMACGKPPLGRQLAESLLRETSETNGHQTTVVDAEASRRGFAVRGCTGSHRSRTVKHGHYCKRLEGF